MTGKSTICIIALVILVTSLPAFAGWTVTCLGTGTAVGMSGGQQVGYTGQLPYRGRACMWNGSASSFVDLSPTGYGNSYGMGVSNGRQVGYAFVGFSPHAGMWSGTAASWVDLNPAGHSSHAYAIFGDQQVGAAGVALDPRSGGWHASLWSGTAGSWVDLTPWEGIASYAYGVFDGQQVGSLGINVRDTRASLWSGTPESWVDLSPPGWEYCCAYGIADGQQVGYTSRWNPPGSPCFSTIHAALWSGTAESWVDLDPGGCASSYAYSVSHGKQVGQAYFAGSSRAGMWSGTAASWFNLHSLLPAGYTDSEARSIEVNGNDIWIAGRAGTDAVLWHYTPDAVPEPSSLLALGSGILVLARIIRRRNRS